MQKKSKNTEQTVSKCFYKQNLTLLTLRDSVNVDAKQLNSERRILTLQTLNPNKACGPRGRPSCVFKENAWKIAPCLSMISLDTDHLPKDWKYANFTCIQERQRGSFIKLLSCNPKVSCMLILEHIIFNSGIKYTERHNIIVDHQNGLLL